MPNTILYYERQARWLTCFFVTKSERMLAVSIDIDNSVVGNVNLLSANFSPHILFQPSMKRVKGNYLHLSLGNTPNHTSEPSLTAHNYDGVDFSMSYFTAKTSLSFVQSKSGFYITSYFYIKRMHNQILFCSNNLYGWTREKKLKVFEAIYD